jgi:hypothetical protein
MLSRGQKFSCLFVAVMPAWVFQEEAHGGRRAPVVEDYASADYLRLVEKGSGIKPAARDEE